MEIRNLAREHEYISSQKPPYVPWQKNFTPEEYKTWMGYHEQSVRYHRLLNGQMVYEMGERVKNVLARNGIFTDYDLIRHSPQQLLSFTNFGIKSLNQVVRILALHGYTLKEEENGNINRRTNRQTH
jgi:DNA-directed RNA polymerase alpha subunit